MNDFLARGSQLHLSRRPESAGRPVAEAQSSGQTASQRDRNGARALLREQQLSSAAEVAEAQAKIAALLAELDGLRDPSAIDVDAVEARTAALMPRRPTIIVPLPPASREVVERAVEIAESIRASAALALTAQANAEPGTVEGLLDRGLLD